MSEFVEYLKEVFSQFGHIQARKMFGGYGIYFRGTMFGLVADDILYLKVNATVVKYFEEKGLKPFEFQKGDKIVQMSYYMAPDEILDNPEKAAQWAARSYTAAIQSKSKSKR